MGTDRLLELATESEGKVEKNDIKGDWSQRLVGRLFRVSKLLIFVCFMPVMLYLLISSFARTSC